MPVPDAAARRELRMHIYETGLLMGQCRTACRSLLVLIVLFAVGPALHADEAVDQKLYHRGLRSAVWVVTVHPKTSEQKAADAGEREVRVARSVEIGSGSGAIINFKQRLVLTNAHVVGDNEKVLIYFPLYVGDKLLKERDRYWSSKYRSSGKVVAKDPVRDLAVVQVESLPKDALEIALAGHAPRLGDAIHSIGNPGESKDLWIFRSGEVLEDVHRKLRATDPGGKMPAFVIDCQVVFTDLPTRPGESGSPLFNDRAELVGVMSGMGRESKQGYAVEVGEVKALLRSKELLAKLPTTPAADRPSRSTTARAERRTPPPALEETPEQTAARKLKLAKMMADGGVPDKARERYREILRKYPDTEAAKEARRMLEESGE